MPSSFRSTKRYLKMLNFEPVIRKEETPQQYQDRISVWQELCFKYVGEDNKTVKSFKKVGGR